MDNLRVKGLKIMYRMIDLCAGIGGIRRGFEIVSEEFTNVLSAEKDKYACITYEHLYGDNPMNDVTDPEFKKLVKNTEFEILLAGFPCQSFSRAGKEEGFLDTTRGTIFFDIAEMIRDNRPKAFLLENVDNLISHKGGHTFKTILNVLINELNYKIIGVEKDEQGNIVFDRKDILRNSKNFGVPQNRPRVYIMGINNDLIKDKTLLEKLALPIASENIIYEDVNSLLDENVDYKYYVASGNLNSLKAHKRKHAEKGNGFGYMIINKDRKAISNALLATGGSGKERNFVVQYREGVPGTIIANKKTPLNDEYVRNMTPAEWAKLQGFKNYAFIDQNGNDNFTFPPKISDAQQYKQLGNAVTIPVIEEMAKFMLHILKKVDGN